MIRVSTGLMMPAIVIDMSAKDLLDDFIVNSVNINVLLQRASSDDSVVLRDVGSMTDRKLAGHTTSPTTVDWEGDGVREWLVGAEDGFFYHHANPLDTESIQSNQAGTP